MNAQPDWIKGGDPHRTEWSGGKDLFTQLDIRWHKSGEWSEGGRIITIESATSERGEHVAIRIQGEIEGTTRGVPGELGWCKRDGEDLMIPFVSPRTWSPPWLLWFHGEIGREELFDQLGLTNVDPKANRILMKFEGDLPDRRISRQISSVIRRALPAVIIGFILGWSVKASVQQSSIIRSNYGREVTSPQTGKNVRSAPEENQKAEHGRKSIDEP